MSLAYARGDHQPRKPDGHPPELDLYISLGSVHSFRIHLTDSFLTSELDLYQSGFALELDLYQSRLALELDLYQSRLMGSDPQEGLTHLRCISGGRKPPCDNFHFSPKPADAACPSSAVVRLPCRLLWQYLPLLIDQTLTQNKQGTVNKTARKHVHPIQIKSPHTRCTPLFVLVCSRQISHSTYSKHEEIHGFKFSF